MKARHQIECNGAKHYVMGYQDWISHTPPREPTPTPDSDELREAAAAGDAARVQRELTRLCSQIEADNKRRWDEWGDRCKAENVYSVALVLEAVRLQYNFRFADLPKALFRDGMHNAPRIELADVVRAENDGLLLASGKWLRANPTPTPLTPTEITANMALLAHERSEKAATTPAMSARQITEAEIRAVETTEDAIRNLQSAFPALATNELHAGIMDVKGTPWKTMMHNMECSRATVSKRLTRFYESTGWPRRDRRRGMGKKLHLDEARDGDTEHGEHCEHADE